MTTTSTSTSTTCITVITLVRKDPKWPRTKLEQEQKARKLYALISNSTPQKYGFLLAYVSEEGNLTFKKFPSQLKCADS